MKWLVHEHCKKLMLNLMYTFIEQSNPRLTRDKLLDAVNFPLAVDHSVGCSSGTVLIQINIQKFLSFFLKSFTKTFIKSLLKSFLKGIFKLKLLRLRYGLTS